MTIDEMSIDEHFNIVAKEYDTDRRKFLPCFDTFYKDTTKFVANSIPTPHRILDLGAGTGLLTAFWYSLFPEADYVLVDVASEMLDVARLRFKEARNVAYEILNYSESLPATDFDTIVSALSIHHLEHTGKQQLFRKIYEKLPDDGVFVNYDQFCGETKEMSRLLDNFWIDGLMHSGLSKLSLERWQERKKLDRECSMTDEYNWLKSAGFRTVQCVYSYQKFSVLMAIK